MTIDTTEAPSIVDVRIPAPSAEVATRAQASLTTARAITVDSPVMFELAAEELQAVKAKWRELDEQRKGMTEPLRLAEKRINDFFRAPLAYLADAESVIKGAMLTFTQAEEAKRREQQRLADEAAAAERRRLQEEARAAEAKAREEAARVQREIEAKEAAARAEREKAEAAARAAAEAGRQEEAERIAKAAAEQRARDEAAAAAAREKAAREAEEAQQRAAALVTQAAMTIAAPVAAAPAAKGISTPGTWSCEVEDKAKAVAYIAAHPEYLHLVELDKTACNALARAQKQNLAIPGLLPKFTQRIASR